MGLAKRIAAGFPQVTYPEAERVIESCNQLVDFHAWDSTKVNYRGWLQNFSQSELVVASSILRRFTFFADHLVDQLFESAFKKLAAAICKGASNRHDAENALTDFARDCIVTIVTDEIPNPTDSGYTFARKARQILGFKQSQIVSPENAVRRIVGGHTGPLVLVDDFVGSGNQFLDTWNRNYQTSVGARSLSTVVTGSFPGSVAYCNVVTTEYGLGIINRNCSNVDVFAGNVFAKSYSLTSQDSTVWGGAEQLAGLKLIESKSKLLGYDESGGTNDWRGFHRLGLAVGFEHSTPDASLPIFFSDRNDWVPLVRRT